MGLPVSAVVCTHNRSTYLRKALHSLTEQTLDRQRYEVLVVDNGSRDNTRQVVEEFASVPNLRYIYEPVLGLSRARNTGYQQARGTYIAYLDDDAVAAPQWLEKIVEVFETFQPAPGAVGGKSEPIWEAPRPAWLSDRFFGHLALIDWSDTPMVVDGEDMWLAGCNIAFPRHLLVQVEGFREDLGRKGIQLIAGEEVYLQQQVKALGYSLVYHPQVCVGHHVAPARLTQRYFRKHRYWMGVTQAGMVQRTARLSSQRRALLLLGKVAWLLPRLALVLVGRSPADRFRRQCQMYEGLGYIAGLSGMHAEAVQ
jgi:GT2 family glycosyltransferase